MRDWFGLDKEVWVFCSGCRAIFTEPFAKETFKRRVEERKQILAGFPEEERMAESRKLGKISGCPFCPQQSLKPVVTLGPKDRRRLVRAIIVRRVFGWMLNNKAY